MARLRPLFDQTVFVDRRVDPEARVTLDIEASSAEQVLHALASEHQFGVGRLGRVIYLGPAAAATQLQPTGDARAIRTSRVCQSNCGRGSRGDRAWRGRDSLSLDSW